MPWVGKRMDRKRMVRRSGLCGGMTAPMWNEACPIGTAVRYWPIWPPIPSVPPVDTRTRSEAWALGDGTVVVLIEGKSGGVGLTHVERLPSDSARGDDENNGGK